MKLTHQFTYDGREADLEVTQTFPETTVTLAVKFLSEVVDTQKLTRYQSEEVRDILEQEPSSDRFELLMGRRREGCTIEFRMTKAEWNRFVAQLEVFGE